MFYALMRPSEVAALTREACYLPENGWGHLVFADASPAAGRAYTDDGQVHQHRGLKGRTSPQGRRPVRKVPIPPELVELLRSHVARFGVGQDGRLFRSENRTPIQPSTWWQVWQKVRATSLIPEQLASPLMKAPLDLRPVRDRNGRRMDRAHGQDAPPGGGPVNSGTCWGQSPSPGGIRWHPVTKRDNGHFHETPGQGQKTPANDRRPQ
jgi:hypothetical protein